MNFRYTSENFTCDDYLLRDSLKISLLQGVGNKGPIQILYHNSALRYAIALNFGRNTTSIALNSFMMEVHII